MKKILQTMTLFMLMVLLGGGNLLAQEKTVTLKANCQNNIFKVIATADNSVSSWAHTFKSGDITTSSTSATLDGISWTIPTKATYAAKSGSLIQLGSKKKPLSNFILETEDFKGTITKVVISASTTSANGEIAVSVGGNSYNTGSSLTTALQECSFEGSSEGNLQITFNGVVNLSKIEVFYSSDTPSKTSTKISFEKGNASFNQGANASGTYKYTNAATVTTSDGTAVEGATVTYSTSDKDHADVDASGTVTIYPTKAGTYTITATYAGNGTYAASEATYTITVKKTLQLTGKGTMESPYTVADVIAIVNANEQTTDNVYVKGIVNYVKTTADNIAKYKNCDYFIVDKEGSTDSIEAFRGKYLGNTDFTSLDQIAAGDKVVLYGTLTKYNNIVELDKNNYIVDFWSNNEMTLDETESNEVTSMRHATVLMARKFNANAWNSLVLPFSMTADQVTATFGEDVKLANYTGTTLNADGTCTLNFTTTTTINANTPVFVYGAKDLDVKSINDVNVVAGDPAVTPDGAAFSFTGSYNNATLEAGDWFISSDNKFYRAQGTESMKATRAVFRPTTTEADAKGLALNLDGATTAINGINADKAEPNNAHAYNIAGQRVAANYHGLIIKGGKKYMNK